MDTKNVLMAVILSTLVLVFWGTFFEPPVSEIQVEKNQITKNNEEDSAPSIEKTETINKTKRIDAIKSVKRIELEINY